MLVFFNFVFVVVSSIFVSKYRSFLSTDLIKALMNQWIFIILYTYYTYVCTINISEKKKLKSAIKNNRINDKSLTLQIQQSN